VTEHGEQLREAFETHETLAPDPAAVYGRVQELARTYKRRRRGAQAAGGAVLGVGLIAGALNLPLGHGGDGALPAASPTTPVPSVAPSYPAAEYGSDLAAYFAAGYGYNDAVQLAALWHTNKNIGLVKAEAGRLLQTGQTLPIAPHPDPTEPPQPTASVKAQQRALDAFFDAGYVWEDAVKLAKLWHLSDPSQAKVAGGKKIEAGRTLPIRPTPENVAAAKDSKAFDEFYNKGYTLTDAATLAKLWHLKDASQAKIVAGEKLLAGKTLPIQP
jgi:hypothetical protein